MTFLHINCLELGNKASVGKKKSTDITAVNHTFVHYSNTHGHHSPSTLAFTFTRKPVLS